jgi:hypothetical protein
MSTLWEKCHLTWEKCPGDGKNVISKEPYSLTHVNQHSLRSFYWFRTHAFGVSQNLKDEPLSRPVVQVELFKLYFQKAVVRAWSETS